MGALPLAAPPLRAPPTMLVATERSIGALCCRGRLPTEDAMANTAKTFRTPAPTDRAAAAQREGNGAERLVQDEFAVIPVRLRESQLRLLEIAAEAATRRLDQEVSVSTIIAALITKYRSELAAEADRKERL